MAPFNVQIMSFHMLIKVCIIVLWSGHLQLLKFVGILKGRKSTGIQSPMVVIRDVEDLNKLNMSVWLTHKMNYQEIQERWIRRTQLIEEMIKVFKELDVEYRLLPLDVNVLNLSPTHSN